MKILQSPVSCRSVAKQLPGSQRTVVGQSPGSHWAVIRQSSGSRKAVSRSLKNHNFMRKLKVLHFLYPFQNKYQKSMNVAESSQKTKGDTRRLCHCNKGVAINWIKSKKILQNKISWNLISFHFWKPPFAATRPPCAMFSWHPKTRKRSAQTVDMQLPCSHGTH